MPCSGFVLGRRLVSPWGVRAGLQRVGASKKGGANGAAFFACPHSLKGMYFAEDYFTPYFLRNLSTRPAVSTSFTLPV